MKQEEFEKVDTYITELHRRVNKALSEINNQNYGTAKEILCLFDMPNLKVVVSDGELPKWKKAPLGDVMSMSPSLRYDDNDYYLEVNGYTLSVKELENKLPKEE